MIHYQVHLADPGAHLIHVRLTLNHPNPQGQIFFMARWVPGSYLIRELAKQVIEVKAFVQNQPVNIKKISNERWQCEPVTQGPLTLCYQVYAWDPSVRGAHFDTTHAFFDGARVFMGVEGQEKEAATVDIQLPDPKKVQGNWQIATTLPKQVPNFEALIDYPVEIGVFEKHTFEVRGVPHHLVVSGQHYGNVTRLCHDLQKACDYFHQLFGEPNPLEGYTFLLSLSQNAHGGLEHRDSSACQASRYQMPSAEGEYSEQSLSLLSLLTHEYFHLWNVKRIKPLVFQPYPLLEKALTRQLWAFEGITAYYDDLSLIRSKVISPEQYCKVLAKSIQQLHHGQGHLKQSVTESSWDAWIKFYQPDENTVNVGVSYYIKGSLVALCIDLKMRQLTQNQYSLDTVMKQLWQRYGKEEKGVPEGAIEKLIVEYAGSTIEPQLQEWLYDAKPLPLAELLGTVGIQMTWDQPSHEHTLGLKFEAHGQSLKVKQVFLDGAAHRAGISAGDILLALDGLMLTEDNYKLLSEQIPLGKEVIIHVFRDDRLLSFPICFEKEAPKKIILSIEDKERSQAWLMACP